MDITFQKWELQILINGIYTNNSPESGRHWKRFTRARFFVVNQLFFNIAFRQRVVVSSRNWNRNQNIHTSNFLFDQFWGRSQVKHREIESQGDSHKQPVLLPKAYSPWISEEKMKRNCKRLLLIAAATMVFVTSGVQADVIEVFNSVYTEPNGSNGDYFLDGTSLSSVELDFVGADFSTEIPELSFGSTYAIVDSNWNLDLNFDGTTTNFGTGAFLQFTDNGDGTVDFFGSNFAGNHNFLFQDVAIGPVQFGVDSAQDILDSFQGDTPGVIFFPDSFGFVDVIEGNVSAVPEPTTASICAAALSGLVLIRRRRS